MECNFKGMTLCNLTSFYENTSLTFVHISMQTSKAWVEAVPLPPTAAAPSSASLTSCRGKTFCSENLLAALNSCSLNKISMTSKTSFRPHSYKRKLFALKTIIKNKVYIYTFLNNS